MTYSFLFYRHIMFRKSCGICPFANTNRPSDITLADFWGWENNVPNMNDDDKGVSLVILNTEKGKKIFDFSKHNLEIKEVILANSLQKNLRHPTIIHPLREQFEKDYIERGFKYIINKYGDISLTYKINAKVNYIKYKFRNLLKKK